MQEEGNTLQEIAEYYGLANRTVVKNLLYRERNKPVMTVPKQRERASKNLSRVQVREQATTDGKQVVTRFSTIYGKEVRAKIKYAVIYRHKEEYPVSAMCRFFEVSRSGYYDYVTRIDQPEKDAGLAEEIRRQQDKCFKTYDYRRMWMVLKKERIHHKPKTVLRVMKKYGLLAEIRRRLK